MADLYLTPAEKYTAALGGFYYGDLPEPGTVYTQLIKDILNGTTPEKEPKNILARFIYSLYISDLGDPYPRYELAKLLYWKLHDITPTKSGSILTVTIDGKEDYMTINTDLSRLWYKVLFGSKTDVITEFPYIFNTMQNKLSDWELFGNVEVSGTPTPDSPIMPEGTGEKTGNLFDGTEYPKTSMSNVGVWVYAADLTGSVYRIPCKPNTTYTLYLTENIDITIWRIRDISTNDVPTAQSTSVQIAQSHTESVPSNKSTTFTTSQNAKYILFQSNANAYSSILSCIMLVEGSTALPYEPHGYKIPISSASTTTPVYLGEIETTRRVKKIDCKTLVWETYQAADNKKRFTTTLSDGITADTTLPYSICSHIPLGSPGGTYNTENCYTINADTKRIYFRLSDDIDTSSALYTFFNEQESKGTPVTVWYVLATEETAVVNEPLMKIGEYADSLSRAQTGIDIPTVIGQNTLDVLTTVKPSSMRIEYTSADETRSRSKRISLLKSPLKKGLIK